jgi:tetratricopeptide (TPR) repeat protein
MLPAVVTSTTPSAGQTPPLVPWRDPQTIVLGELLAHIARLEQACLENPRSADLRTSLGVAYAVNYDVYKAMDALAAATSIDPSHFWGQLKYAELHYRLRALPRAEDETLKAVQLARNPWELSCARKQLQEIRNLLHQSTRNVTWNKPLAMPALVLSVMFLLVFAGMVWR